MNIRPLCAVRNLPHTCSQRAGSANRERGRIEFLSGKDFVRQADEILDPQVLRPQSCIHA